MTEISLSGRGARGESQADILRRTGQFGVLPTDTDAEAVGKLNADAAAYAAAAAAWAEGTLPGGAGTKSAKEYALAAAAEIETKLSLIGGVNGTAFIDTVGNGYGFIPASDGDGDLEFPFLNANDESSRLGPLQVQVIEGVDGIVFTDSVGNSLPIGDEADAGLTAAQVQKIAHLPNSVVTFGHSKTAENSWGGPVNPSNPNGGTARKADLGYLAWLDYYLKGSIDWIHNAGVGGETDAQMLSRVQADVVAKGAAYCIIQGGTCNSINAGLTADQIIALQLGTENADSSNSILGLMQDAGIQTVWLTDPTWATGHPDLTASKFATLCRVNRAMLQAQGYKPGLLAVDTAGLVVDPLSATGASRAYYTQSDDFIHGTPIRGRAQGKLSADRMIAAGFPLMDILPTSLADTYAASSTSKQLLDNPFMTGTGGTGPVGGVVTGTIPTGCRIAVSTPSTAWAAGSITSTTVDRADGFGKDVIVTVNSSPVAGAQVFIILENAVDHEIRTRLSAGDVAQASAQIDITGMSKVNGHEFYCDLGNGTVFPQISTLERDTTANWSSLFYSQVDLTGGVMRTGRASVPSGTLSDGSIRFRMTFDGSAGAATIRMGRAQFLKNS